MAVLARVKIRQERREDRENNAKVMTNCGHLKEYKKLNRVGQEEEEQGLFACALVHREEERGGKKRRAARRKE